MDSDDCKAENKRMLMCMQVNQFPTSMGNELEIPHVEQSFPTWATASQQHQDWLPSPASGSSRL